MAENVIRIEGITPLDGSFTMIQTTPSDVSSSYGYSLHDAAGVVAANNFLSVFNPLASGKNLYLVQAVVSRFAIGASTGAASITINRITTASAGTLQAASTVAKGNTADPNTVAEVRIGNPTVTLGAELIAFSPPLGGNWSTTADVITGSLTSPFILAPGQGLVYRTESGDVNQRWNVIQYWVEADV